MPGDSEPASVQISLPRLRCTISVLRIVASTLANVTSQTRMARPAA